MMCGAESWKGRWLAAILGLCMPLVHAEVYVFDRVVIPPPKSVQGLYLFFVFSKEEAPMSNGVEPEVEFRNFQGALASLSEDTRSVQVSILPFRDFEQRITQTRFCSEGEDVASSAATERNQLLVNLPPGATKLSEAGVYQHVVPFPGREMTSANGGPYPVGITAAYILIISNCGSMEGGTVSGEVHVKNSYGYLPGNEFHKMPFYGALALVYLGLSIMWLGVSLQWKSELFNMHWCIFAVLLLSFAEAFLYWLMLMCWNRTGHRSEILLPTTLLASVSKSVFSYMLVLVASLGWGVIMPTLEDSTIRKVQVISSVYMVLEFVRELMLSFKFSHHLSFTVVLVCLLPVAILNVGIFWWIFTCLFNLIENLKVQKQVEKLALFEKLSTTLTIAMAIAAVSTVAQLVLLPQSLSMRWHYQWFFADGATHVIFLLVLLAMMYLWAPNENSLRFAYSQQIGENDNDAEGDLIGKAETFDEEDNGYANGNKVAPSWAD